MNNEERVHRVGPLTFPGDNESISEVYQLNLKGLYEFSTLARSEEAKDASYMGERPDLPQVEWEKENRRHKCDRLRATRAAQRLANELGMLGSKGTGCDHSPSGRWFQSGGKVIYVDDCFAFALVKVTRTLDC